VGTLLPTTGDLADLGQPIEDGATLPAKQLEGETEIQIDLQAEDSQTDPSAAQSAAQSLVNAGYPAITGAASSEVTIQVAEGVAIQNGATMCSPASTSPAITDLDDDGFVYRTPPTDALQGEVLAQVAAERIEAETAATMFVNNSYGQLLSESFADAFGGEVQEQVSFQKEQSSYTSRIEQAVSGDPDAMVVIGYPASGNQLFRDFYANFDTELPILVTDGLRDPALPSNVDNPMENVRGTAPLAAGPGNEFFSQQYQDEYGREPGVFTAQAYDATACLILANAAAGENTGSAIAEQMTNVANEGGEKFTPENLADAVEAAASGTEINYQGASSAIEFDENGDLTAATYELFGWTEDSDSDTGYAIETIEEIEFSG
jgi:ABC-type branched-subunit amino acid transport system substrate-binding protein